MTRLHLKEYYSIRERTERDEKRIAQFDSGPKKAARLLALVKFILSRPGNLVPHLSKIRCGIFITNVRHSGQTGAALNLETASRHNHSRNLGWAAAAVGPTVSNVRGHKTPLCVFGVSFPLRSGLPFGEKEKGEARGLRMRAINTIRVAGEPCERMPLLNMDINHYELL
jgi:hypothetical protein